MYSIGFVVFPTHCPISLICLCSARRLYTSIWDLQFNADSERQIYREDLWQEYSRRFARISGEKPQPYAKFLFCLGSNPGFPVWQTNVLPAKLAFWR